MWLKKRACHIHLKLKIEKDELHPCNFVKLRNSIVPGMTSININRWMIYGVLQYTPWSGMKVLLPLWPNEIICDLLNIQNDRELD